MTVNIAFCFIHICYRINLRSQPRRKMKVKGFGSRGMKCIANTDQKFIAREKYYGFVFHKTSRILKFISSSNRGRATRGKGLNITMIPQRIYVGTKYKFYIARAREKCTIFP